MNQPIINMITVTSIYGLLFNLNQIVLLSSSVLIVRLDILSGINK